jgi:hypothetical protein
VISPLPIAATVSARNRRNGLAGPSLARACCLAAALGLTALTGGCGDDVSAPETAREIPTDSSQSQELANKDWLTVHDKISPAQWLASREAGHDVPLDDPRVGELHKMLQDAKGVFGTPYRMTANRAVQLEEMIDEEGWEHEDAADLIVTITEVGESNTSGQGFGQIAQAYYQLRKQGLSREEAHQHIEDNKEVQE